MTKFLFILAALLCSLTAHAFAPSVMYGYGTSGTYGFHSTMPAACSAAVVVLPPEYNYSYTHFEDKKCFYAGYAGSESLQATLMMTAVLRCPEHSSLVGGDCVCTPPATQQGNQCVPPTDPSQCADDAGHSSVMNFTVGWARSGNPDADDHVGKVVFPNQGRGAACVGGCSWDFTDNGVTAYRSAEPFPASGLHRLSVDFTMRGAGTACAESPEDAAASPNAPEPPCPGFVGEVNGVTKCVGTASQPVPPPDGPTAGRQAGGSEDNGNPAAGKKPDSGDGSGSGGPGRTPSAGTGGNAGGPAGAAGGTRPDGTTTKPVEGKEQAACGAPGQPKCSINETGTPDGKGAYDAAKAGLDKAEGDYKAGLDAIKNTADKDTSWGVVPSWIAHAECRPWDLGAFEIMGQSFAIVISICDVMPYVVATTSFLWVVATFFLTIAMVFRVTAAPQG